MHQTVMLDVQTQHSFSQLILKSDLFGVFFIFFILLYSRFWFPRIKSKPEALVCNCRLIFSTKNWSYCTNLHLFIVFNILGHHLTFYWLFSASTACNLKKVQWFVACAPIQYIVWSVLRQMVDYKRGAFLDVLSGPGSMLVIIALRWAN